MTEAFKVQRGVPLPAINRPRRGAKRRYPVETMQVGEMFFVPFRTGKSLSAYISRITKNVPGKFSARRTTMRWTGKEWAPTDEGDKRGVEGIGVWRLE